MILISSLDIRLSGVLVVNVTWRGKTYVGTLLDATRHDWAPPRLTEESDERSRSLGFGGRAKRTGQARSLSGSEDNSLSKLRNGRLDPLILINAYLSKVATVWIH